MGEKEAPVRKFECSSCKYSDYRMSAREVGETVPYGCPRCGQDMKVAGAEFPDWLAEPLKLVSAYFNVIDFVALETGIEVEVTTQDPKRSFRSLMKMSKPLGYLPIMREQKEGLKLVIVRYPPVKPGRIWVNFLLFGLTIMTTFAAGYFLFDNNVFHAALFSSAIMLMLGAHEMGHKIAAWRNGIQSTMPYFIPAPPPFIGTAGAVISIKSPIPTKEALVELGASGPLFGFFMALPLTALGLMLSTPDPEGISLWFTPAIFAGLQLLTFGYVPAGMRFSPLALAGWLALFVTMLNLLPAGQLDGGHIMRGLIGKDRHYTLTRTLGFALFLMGILFPESPMWLWGFMIIMFFRGHHPGALDDISGLSRRQKLLALAALVVFLLCLPVPVG